MPTTDCSARSRSNAKSPGFGCAASGISHSIVFGHHTPLTNRRHFAQNSAPCPIQRNAPPCCLAIGTLLCGTIGARANGEVRHEETAHHRWRRCRRARSWRSSSRRSFISADAYKDQILSRVRDATGRDVTIGGPLSLSLFPNVRVEASDVMLANAPGAAIAGDGEAEEARHRGEVDPAAVGSARSRTPLAGRSADRSRNRRKGPAELELRGIGRDAAGAGARRRAAEESIDDGPRGVVAARGQGCVDRERHRRVARSPHQPARRTAKRRADRVGAEPRCAV